VSLGSFITVYAISERAWKQLPEDMRKVLEEAGKHAQKTHCEYVDATEPKVIQELEGYGVVANHMAAGQLEALNTSLAEVGTQWAKSLDDRRRPGTDVLKAFQEAVAKK